MMKESAPHRRCACGATLAPETIAHEEGSVVARVGRVEYQCRSCGESFSTAPPDVVSGVVSGPILVLVGLGVLWAQLVAGVIILPGPLALVLGVAALGWGTRSSVRAVRELTNLSRHPVVEVGLEPGAPLPPATAETPFRRCSCGGTLGAYREVRNQFGGLVAAHYRCTGCDTRFGVREGQRLGGSFVVAALSLGFGITCLTQAPRDVRFVYLASPFLLLGVWLLLGAAREVRDRARFPILAA